MKNICALYILLLIAIYPRGEGRALLSGTYTTLLKPPPRVGTRLKDPHPKGRKRDFATVAKEVQSATVVVLVV